MSDTTALTTQFHSIGQERPVYLIAEIGLNHNGDETLARKMVDAAVQSGAHCAKFQLFDSAHFISSRARLGEQPPGSLQSFFRQFEMSATSWRAIARHCEAQRIDFLCSVFDEPSLDRYQDLGGRAVKIASTDMTCRPLLESVKARGLQIYLSTGASDAMEIEQTVQWVGLPELLFQCVSSYPADPLDYNLGVLSGWQAHYQCLTGISDHCMDLEVSLLAPAVKAVAIERHFTLDRSLPGPDQSLSSTPEQFQELSRMLARIQHILGDGQKRCMPSEEPVRRGGRRSLYFTQSFGAGHRLQTQDLRAMRPRDATDPDPGLFSGRPLKTSVQQDAPLQPEMLD